MFTFWAIYITLLVIVLGFWVNRLDRRLAQREDDDLKRRVAETKRKAEEVARLISRS